MHTCAHAQTHACKALGARLTQADKLRIRTCGVQTVKKFIDKHGKKRCTGHRAVLKATQPWAQCTCVHACIVLVMYSLIQGLIRTDSVKLYMNVFSLLAALAFIMRWANAQVALVIQWVLMLTMKTQTLS